MHVLNIPPQLGALGENNHFDSDSERCMISLCETQEGTEAGMLYSVNVWTGNLSIIVLSYLYKEHLRFVPEGFTVPVPEVLNYILGVDIFMIKHLYCMVAKKLLILSFFNLNSMRTDSKGKAAVFP